MLKTNKNDNAGEKAFSATVELRESSASVLVEFHRQS